MAYSSLWFRKGNYFKNSCVEYCHPTASILKQIKIRKHRFFLYETVFNKNLLFNAASHFFKTSQYKVIESGIFIIIDSIELQNNLLLLLAYLKKEHGSKIQLEDIILDVKHIFEFINKKTIYEHIISEGIFSDVHVHTNTKQLLEILKFPDEELSIQQCKKCLIRGEDPNQNDLVGYGPIHLIILSAAYTKLISVFISIVKLLLCYGANPFFRKQDSSAIELAFKWQRIEILQLFVTAFSTLEKNIFNFNKSAVFDTDIFLHDNSVIAALHFYNGKTIRVQLKNSYYISSYEKSLVLNLFQQYTEISKLKKMYDEEFTGIDVFIQILWDSQRCIGFNLFKVVTFKNQIYLYSAYSILEKEYRGSGLIALIAFQVAYSLQLLTKNKVTIIFCASHYNSYRLVNGFDHFPKYQSINSKNIANKILNIIFNTNINLFGDCYIVEDDFRVKGSYFSKSSPDLLEEFFYNEILAINNNLNQESRSAIIMFEVLKNYAKFTHLLFKMGIKSSYIWNLGQCVDILFGRLMQDNTNSITTASKNPWYKNKGIFSLSNTVVMTPALVSEEPSNDNFIVKSCC